MTKCPTQYMYKANRTRLPNMKKRTRGAGTSSGLQTVPVTHHTSRTCHWHISEAHLLTLSRFWYRTKSSHLRLRKMKRAATPHSVDWALGRSMPSEARALRKSHKRSPRRIPCRCRVSTITKARKVLSVVNAPARFIMTRLTARRKRFGCRRLAVDHK